MPKCLAAWMAALLAVASMACGAAEDVPANVVHMKALAQREAARGDKGAQAYLDFLAGTGGAKAMDDGVTWVAAAAHRGRPEAQYQIAAMFEVGAQKNPERAAEMHGKAAALFRKAADQGYAPAQTQLALLHATGRGVAQDNAKAMEWATKAALGGDVDAQGWIGAKYLEGKIVPKDIARGIEWLEKAAKQGNVVATLLLIGTYQNGKDVPADPEKAKYWLERIAGKAGAKPDAGTDLVAAAERGDVDSQASLGFNYLTGRGFPKDGKQALHWLTRAAESGHAIAQVNLGVTYAGGIIVAKDDARAIMWFRRAADQGNRSGQRRLAVMYESGRGVKRDKAAAIELYRKAAAQGDAFSIERLKKLGVR